ncbi:peptidyl-prolyl cis-trans isomerase FKBP53-like [Magnolia sinica]|uniref:peptidyl-prolyl cis-trans isomerase FKBP53-like n=1 Tax=Magnolia sinica TaxID=86752 RepID=UPI002658594F|nr:peptidyl-prolyl cis-trans isomerase FKBP53-like [Magnolia sinica]XP_058075481.1 peptidyl-prolyl cis-trans isomerase FKBP53-like [Magnolia sinica]
MAFWGVEVKPGKPYTHQYDDTHGRLHISQATLDYGPSMKKSVVQCNVGNKTPVLLCSLLPEKIESCPLNLEFEEADEVVFSVLGPKSVHLTGYYLGSSRRYNQDGDDTDSYGEDIADTETDRSNETEDEYDDDFIDDGDPELFLASPQLRSSGVINDEILDDVKPTNKSGTRRRLKKKYQASDSEGDNGDHAKVFGKHTSLVVLESEDEDCIPLSAIRRSEQNVSEKAEDKLDNNSAGEVRKNRKGEDDGDQGMLLKRKIDAIEQDGNREREANQTCGSLVLASGVAAENGLKSKKKKKERAKELKILESGVSLLTDKTMERASREQNQAIDDGQINIPNDGKDWSLEANIDNMDQDLPIRGDLKEKLPSNENAIDSIPSDVVIVEFNGRPKKKKNKSSKDTALKQEVDPSSETVDKASYDNGKSSHIIEEAKSEMIDQDMPVRAQESSAKLPDDHQNEGKKQKKKLKRKASDTNKNNEGSGLTMMEEKTEYAKEIEMKAEVQISEAKTSDGLVIEELSMGNPDGKRASHGNKVSIYYTGRLNENGKVFDSNIGQKAFKFRLGKGRVIEGWDAGIPGMRIGDKRRLIIPPSFGYGPEGAGEVPGNAWLMYDVELVDVR